MCLIIPEDAAGLTAHGLFSHHKIKVLREGADGEHEALLETPHGKKGPFEYPDGVAVF